MLSRLSSRCTRLPGQGGLIHHCTRRTFPKEARTAAAQRAFATTRCHRSYDSELLAEKQDEFLEKHWNRVEKLSHKTTLYSKRELEYQMSIIRYLQAEKNYLRDDDHMKALMRSGGSLACLRRISNIYSDMYLTGDRLLAYARSGRALPSYIEYTPEVAAWARSCAWKVPLVEFLKLLCIKVVVLSIVGLSVWMVLWMLWRLRRKTIEARGEIGENDKVHRAASTPGDLEHTA